MEVRKANKISDIVNLFSSLLSERLKSKLNESFPNISFAEIKSSSTLNDIYEIIFRQKNNLVKKIDSLDKNKKNLSSNTKNFASNLSLLENNSPLLGVDI